MNAKSTKRVVREGDFVAEVDVHLVEAQGGWTPYLSLEDAYKLDDVRDALRAGLTYGLMWQGVETSTSVPGATP